MRSQADLVELGKRYLYPNYKQPPLVMARGQGCELWDVEGKRYLDLYAGIAVHILGHVHPIVTAAIAEQAATLMQVSNYFYNAPNVELAARLCAVTHMDRVFFCNSGSETIEAMLKLARRHFFALGQVQRNQVIAFEGSFHGRTLGALAATGQPSYREGFGALPDVTHVPYGDIDAVTNAIDEHVCAILVEAVQGEGGVLPAPAGFLQSLRALADRHGILLLADEIQSGLGRTGRFLAFEHANVKPDAVALAKGLAGGIPVGAMLCGEHLAKALPPGSHGSTFGGNPLASRAALAVLEVIEQQNLLQEATRKGAVLGNALQALCDKHPKHLRSTRGVGLLRALVLASHVDARALQGKIRDLGVLVTVAGGSTLRFTPPLIITDDQIAQGLAVIDRALTALDSSN